MLAVGEEGEVAGVPADDPAVPLGVEPVDAPDPVEPGDVAVPEGVDPVVLPVDGAGVGAGLGVGATAGDFDDVAGGAVSRLSQADNPSTNPILQSPIVNVRMIASWLSVHRGEISSFDAIAMRALISLEIRVVRALRRDVKSLEKLPVAALFARIFCASQSSDT